MCIYRSLIIFRQPLSVLPTACTTSARIHVKHHVHRQGCHIYHAVVFVPKAVNVMKVSFSMLVNASPNHDADASLVEDTIM